MMGFLRFYIATIDGGSEEFAAYSADNILHCVLQKEYTEDQVVSDISHKGITE